MYNNGILSTQSFREYIERTVREINVFIDLEVLKKKFDGVLYGIPSQLGMVDKYLKDDKVVLAGDFFHTKAARLSSEFGISEIPYYIAIIEETQAKV